VKEQIDATSTFSSCDKTSTAAKCQQLRSMKRRVSWVGIILLIITLIASTLITWISYLFEKKKQELIERKKSLLGSSSRPSTVAAHHLHSPVMTPVRRRSSALPHLHDYHEKRKQQQHQMEFPCQEVYARRRISLMVNDWAARTSRDASAPLELDDINSNRSHGSFSNSNSI